MEIKNGINFTFNALFPQVVYSLLANVPYNYSLSLSGAYQLSKEGPLAAALTLLSNPLLPPTHQNLFRNAFLVGTGLVLFNSWTPKNMVNYLFLVGVTSATHKLGTAIFNRLYTPAAPIQDQRAPSQSAKQLSTRVGHLNRVPTSDSPNERGVVFRVHLAAIEQIYRILDDSGVDPLLQELGPHERETVQFLQDIRPYHQPTVSNYERLLQETQAHRERHPDCPPGLLAPSIEMARSVAQELASERRVVHPALDQIKAHFQEIDSLLASERISPAAHNRLLEEVSYILITDLFDGKSTSELLSTCKDLSKTIKLDAATTPQLFTLLTTGIEEAKRRVQNNGTPNKQVNLSLKKLDEIMTLHMAQALLGKASRQGGS